jgi:hypothetical protein
VTLARCCESCKTPIRKPRFVEVTVRLLRADQGENQDSLDEAYGDYCASCVKSGRALTDALSGLTKYPGTRGWQ